MTVITITTIPTKEGIHVTYEKTPVSIEVLNHCEVFGKIKDTLFSLHCSNGKPVTRIISEIGYQSVKMKFYAQLEAVYLKDYPFELEDNLKVFNTVLAEKMG
ncbi:MAG: hypothetical protein WC791_00700 [Candidatus Paceibacterota bacterium]|jgi:tRNA U55 pseudouridine synthase TruB